MTYLALLEEEGINAQYMVVMRPARRVVSFTLSSGSIYFNDFDFGYVSAIAVDGISLTLHTSSTLSAGQFYYDHEAGRIYIRKTDSTAPDASDYIVVTYEIHAATFDAHWYRNPTDNTTTEVYFDPIISSVPEIKSSVTDVLFGLLPTLSTSIGLVNAEHFLEKHVYDSSFLNKEILVYHWLDELETTNLKLVLRGRMGDVSYSGGRGSIRVFDTTDIFNKEFRSTGDAQFFNVTDFPRVDPQFIGKPIRTVYGRVDGFVPVNVDHTRDDPTTSDNRDWIVRANGALSHAVTATVTASPASTNTRTYLDSVVGLCVGDSIWLDKTTDEYRFITVVGANYIEHEALASGAATTGNTVKRGTVGNIEIIQNGVRYRAHYNRDWTESVHLSGALQFTLSSSLETSLSMPATLSSTDTVYARVYGKRNLVTLSGGAFGTNSAIYGNLTNAAVILFDILKTYQGLAESEINLTSFTTLLADVTDEIGFAIPASALDPYTKTKEVILRVMQSSLAKLYQDFDSKWKVSASGPIASTTKDITDDEIIRGSIDYAFDYSDVYSDFVVKYAIQEQSESTFTRSSSVRVESGYAKYVHGQSRTYETTSIHVDEAGAENLAEHLSFILGDRQGTYSLSTKNRFFDNIVADEISVTTEKLPGFEYNSDTERTRDFVISQIEKSLRRVKIKLTDQKGIQDNEASW